MAERSSYQEGTPCWVDLASSDPADARAFYGELFGWEFEIGGEEFGYYTMAKVRGKNVAGLAGQFMPDAPVAWTTYFATDDADKTAAKVREHGGTVLAEPMDVPGSGRMALATDPGGALFGLWQAGGHPGALLVNEPGAVVWNELTTRDLGAAGEFYSAVLGVTPQALDTGGGPAYQTLHVSGDMVAGAMQLDDSFPADFRPQWTPYFVVADTDAAAAKAGELGATVIAPPDDSPYGRFSVLTDRQGGMFSIITPPAG
jgi:predicted enzyme related to lactoylglutathione lyase